MRIKLSVVGVSLAVGLAVFAAGAAAKNPNGDQPTPIARGPHVSGVARYQPKPSASPSAGQYASCSRPGVDSSTGVGNYRTDCNSSGRPVNETWVTSDPNGGTLYAGANDYNSYNGQGQDGFYWSSDGVNWNDAGPLDVFPHNNNNGAGDPGLAVDGNGNVYYSSLFFNFYRCNVGGVELLRRGPSSNSSWTTYQIAANSSSGFQDKPAITVSNSSVYVSWTQFGSCSGSNVQSPIMVAKIPTGLATINNPLIVKVPGSTYSQGSSIASDGNGGFWVAWEEWPTGTSTTGSIRLAHYDGSNFVDVGNSSLWETISASKFRDLPSPLPGFAFRDNSFPALTVTRKGPAVTWTSYDSGVGRAYLWQQSGSATQLDLNKSDGDQFFPSIAPDGFGGVYVAYSQVNAGTKTYDQWLWYSGSATKVSTVSSNPSNDAFFSGQFIGDYNGMVADGTAAHPIWTDIRSSDPNYPGWEMDSMFASAAPLSPATVPDPPTGLTAAGGPGVVDLSWTAPSNDGGATITGYDVYRGQGTTSSCPSLARIATNVAGPSYTDSDSSLSPSTSYCYYVTAVNSVGESSQSNIASAAPSQVQTPGAPTNVQAQTKGPSIQLTWTAPSGSVVTYYEIWRSQSSSGSFASVGTTSSTSYRDNPPSRRTTYHYYVTAWNSAGEGPASSPAVSATTK